MKLTILALLAGAFVASISGTPVDIESRIMGGTGVTDASQSSYVACITDVATGMPVGNGWLYSDSWIVTTANLVAGKAPSSLKVTVGMISQKVPIVGQADYIPLDIITHPDFNSTTLFNNVALLKMPRMALSSNIYFIDYDDADTPPSNDAPTTGTITGWGATMDGGLPSQKLNTGTISVFTDAGTTNATLSPCTKQYTVKKYNNTVMMCAGSPNGTTPIVSPCAYDEGSPLVQTVNGVNVVVGMFALNAGCKVPTTGVLPPSIFTRVNHYFYWFKNTAGLASGGTIPTAACNNCVTSG